MGAGAPGFPGEKRRRQHLPTFANIRQHLRTRTAPQRAVFSYPSPTDRHTKQNNITPMKKLLLVGAGALLLGIVLERKFEVGDKIPGVSSL